MNRLVAAITSDAPQIRDQSLDSLCAGASLEQLLSDCEALDQFRRSSDNLYERVRALFFLYAIHRFHVPLRTGARAHGLIPFSAYNNLLRRRFLSRNNIRGADLAYPLPSEARQSTTIRRSSRKLA